jgi:methylmalonyl-CoA/ethylmalonyl-CoA epimerase
MLRSLKFHHIGFATDNIEEAKSFFLKLGYTPGEDVFVPSQKVKVCFLNKTDQPQVELITSAGDDSPVDTILRKCGPGPYHLCYSVPDINEAIAGLKKEKFIILNKPVKSNAIDENNIIFAYRKSYGLVEIVEIPEK